MIKISDENSRFLGKANWNVFSLLKRFDIITVLSVWLVMCIVCSLLFFSLNKSRSEIYAGYYEKMKPGYIASETVHSDSAYYLIDEEASEEAYLRAQLAVPPVFCLDLVSAYQSIGNASALAADLQKDRDSFLSEATDLGLSYETASQAWNELSGGAGFFGTLITQLAQSISELGLMDDRTVLEYQDDYNVIYIARSSQTDASDMTLTGLSSILTVSGVDDYIRSRLDYASDMASDTQISLICELVRAVCVPDLSYSEILTEKVRDALDPASSQVAYSLVPNEIIVQENTIITHEASRILFLLSKLETSVPALKAVGSILMLLLVSGGALLMLDYFCRNSLHKFIFMMVFLCGSIVSDVLAWLVIRLTERLDIAFSGVLLPVLVLPLLISQLTSDRKVGVVTAVSLTASFCLIPGTGVSTVLFCLLSSVSCIMLIRYMVRRTDAVKHWLFTMALSLVSLFVSMMLANASLRGFFVCAEIELIAILIAFIADSALLPVLETGFNIPAQFKLRELAQQKSPVLERLSQEAPGTYSHSMAVADIAEPAARAVGADAALVRVGAMYHDIGKIDHAEYFTENSSLVPSSPEKSHENINRNLSVAIIKSHVKLGVEKGRQLGLPQEVLDIIGNHHGNDVVTYFYNEALKLHQENPEQYGEPKIEEYAYLGEPPQTPEQAIVMLSDCSEAACRSIAKPTPNKIEKMIRMILVKKIVNNQLNLCGMTITDLNKVVKSLSESLTGRYHSRISYPDEVNKT